MWTTHGLRTCIHPWIHSSIHMYIYLLILYLVCYISSLLLKLLQTVTSNHSHSYRSLVHIWPVVLPVDLHKSLPTRVCLIRWLWFLSLLCIHHSKSLPIVAASFFSLQHSIICLLHEQKLAMFSQSMLVIFVHGRVASISQVHTQKFTETYTSRLRNQLQLLQLFRSPSRLANMQYLPRVHAMTSVASAHAQISKFYVGIWNAPTLLLK